MSVIVTDTGFHHDDWKGGFVGPEDLAGRPWAVKLGVHIPSSAATEPLVRHFPTIGLLRVHLSHFTDARGFALAERLRALGYAGRLRAQGHVLADHYTLARRAGFDEVEISADLALRQPEEHWRFRGHWRHATYRSRMRA